MVRRDTAFVTAYRESILLAGGQGILVVVAVLPAVQTATASLNAVVADYDPNNPSTNDLIGETRFQLGGFIEYDAGSIAVANVPESPGSVLVPATPNTYLNTNWTRAMTYRFRFLNPVGFTGVTTVQFTLEGTDLPGDGYTLNVTRDNGSGGLTIISADDVTPLIRTDYSATPQDVYWIFFKDGLFRADRIYPTRQNFFIRKFTPLNPTTRFRAKAYFFDVTEGAADIRVIGQGLDHILYTYEGAI